jgi:hypothetical protein
MVKIEKYTGTKTYMYPNGQLATPADVRQRYPACLTFPHIVETDAAGQVLGAIENLSQLRSLLGVDPGLNEEEAIAKIEELRNTPPPEPEPDASERIAAALEYQNLMSV